MKPVLVVSTGTANLASVLAALRRAGATPRLSDDPVEIRRAERIVLPGVGSFGAGMAALASHGLIEPLVTQIGAGRPFLGICLGMQMLASASEEAEGHPGLGVLDRVVTRFAGGIRVPQLGWRRFTPDGAGRLLAEGWAYFAHSFKLDTVPAGWSAAWADHGGRYVAAIERGPQLGCQFHPELSGASGQALIERWLADEPAPRTAAAAAVSAGSTAVRVVPCLDTRHGRVVKGVQFAGLRDAGDPATLAALYESQGADELVLLDISATPEQRGHALETVRRVRDRLGIPLTAGGGVRSVEAARALLEAGADKVSVNTAAVDRPELLEEIAARFGRQCVVLALDAVRRSEGEAEVVAACGRRRTGRDAVAWAREAVRRGAGEILLTSFDRDGTRRGYDLELIGSIARAVTVPVIASGGADSPAHFIEAARAGADAVLAATVFHDGEWTVAAVKDAMALKGVEVRR